jgi:hypothetical protein
MKEPRPAYRRDPANFGPQSMRLKSPLQETSFRRASAFLGGVYLIGEA